ncbi:signal peptidase I [Ralstonia pickettii]|nr:signal peptidase I [Ralstonia pickettii]
MDERFLKLNETVSLSEKSKEKMRRALLTPSKQKQYLFPKALSLIVTVFTAIIIFSFIVNHKAEDLTETVILDANTPELLPNIEVSHNMCTIEWLSDAMDRGNHDLQTDFHGKLVISQETEPLDRGEIIYYQAGEEEQIGRVVGLPGEKVEIRDGQVYVNEKELQTFYGGATSLGLTRDEYFARAPKDNVNDTEMEKYFATSMEAVHVEKNTVFVLVDMWWRGIDSRELGLISDKQIKGKVLGYEK